MPRTYEAVYIFDSTLEDSAINDKITRFHGLLGASPQPEVAHWGRRQLAYSIGPRENGYYVVSNDIHDIKTAQAQREASIARAQADQERVIAETASQAKQAEADQSRCCGRRKHLSRRQPPTWRSPSPSKTLGA